MKQLLSIMVISTLISLSSGIPVHPTKSVSSTTAPLPIIPVIVYEGIKVNKEDKDLLVNKEAGSQTPGAEERASMSDLMGGGGNFGSVVSLLSGDGGVSGEILRMLMYPFDINSSGSGLYGGSGNPFPNMRTNTPSGFPNIPSFGPNTGGLGGFGLGG